MRVLACTTQFLLHKIMKQRRLLVSIGFLLTATILFAQQPIVLALPDTSTQSGDTLRIDITTRQFTEIVSFQFSFKWDSQVIQYAGFEMTDLPGVAVGTSAAATGTLRFSWFDVQGAGQTLPDGSSIVRLKFFVNGTEGNATNLTITDKPIDIQIFQSDGDGGFREVTLNPDNGKVTIGMQAVFQASFNLTNIQCRGDSIGAINTNLTNLPSGATIRWTGPNNFQSQQEDLTRLIAGNYTLKISNNGATLLDSVFTITQPTTALEIDTIALVQASCTRTTGDASGMASGGIAPYQYSLGNNFGTNNQFTNLTTGFYTLTVRDANNCLASDTFRIEAIGAPQLNLPDTISLCNGQTDTLDAGPQVLYRWSTGATTRSIAVSTIGTYSVTVTNSNGCIAIDSVWALAGSAGLPPLPDSILLCAGQSTTLDAGTFAAYRWSTGATTRTIPATMTGNYSVTVTDAAGCTASDFVQVQVAIAPQVSLGDTAFICNGENLMLDAGVFPAYHWSTGATTRSINVSTAGNYSVTVTNAANCMGSDTIRVQTDTPFEAMIENDTLSVCSGASIQLRASLADSYQWIDTSKTLSALDIRNPTAQPRTTVAYTLIASNSCGIDTVKVEIAVLQALGTAGQDKTITLGDELELNASGGVSYFWFLTDYPVSNARIPNPTTKPEDTTSYFVMITDVNGCQKLDTITVFVADDSVNVKTVNLITPNGDDKNDVLEFKDIEKFGINTLKVYNRWGDLVYQKINYQKDDDRFDGTRKGKPLPAGNYYYVLSFREKEYKQTLTILRE